VEYLQNIFADLARYPIDGVLFQDDLVLRHTEGFGPEAARRYQARFGSQLLPESLFFTEGGRIRYRPEFRAWVEWKNRIILEVIDGIAEAAAESRPDLYWVLNGYYESATDPENGLAWYAQDLIKALSHRIDYIAIMAYHRQIMEELQISYGEVLDLLSAMTRDVIEMTGDPGRVLIKVQTLDWHTERPLPAYEIRQVINAVLAGGSPGLVYVRGMHPPPLTPIRKTFLP
jgi:biofilm PGA synthesis lipoprotein PgaB